MGFGTGLPKGYPKFHHIRFVTLHARSGKSANRNLTCQTGRDLDTIPKMLNSRPTLLYLLDYMAWADQELLTACSALTSEELDRDLGISHASLLGTVRHMFIAEHDWLARLRSSLAAPGVEIASELLYADPPPGPGLPALLERWPEIWKGLRDFVRMLPESELDAEFLAMGIRVSRSKLILHVVNHATLHRGQAIGIFRLLGKHPPGTDLLTYHEKCP